MIGLLIISAKPPQINNHEMVRKMPNDVHTDMNIGDVKSTGTMDGEIFIDKIYSHAFKADVVLYVNNASVIQIYGRQGESQESTVIAVSLTPGTPSGAYKFGEEPITALDYYPPRDGALWKVTGGGVNINFDEEGKRATGTLQVLCERGVQKLEATVNFNITN